MRKYPHSTIICSLIAIMSLALAGTLVSAGPPEATPVGTAFTYQGQLKDGGGNPITNTCDFQFGLYDALASGNQIGTTQTVTSVTVTSGYFTSSLGFGAAAFGGDARWLEIAVRCPPEVGYTTLSPRQPLTPAPYSLYALNAGLLNNLPSTSFQQHYQNLVVVAKSGGDYTTITDALNSIPTHDQDHRFLIYVAPGTYTEQVTMKQYVDIEGAGELATKITQTGSASANTGTVIGANYAELRFLTVENTGGYSYATAIYNSSASPRLTHITATASGGTWNYGVYNNSSSSPAMTNVTASASGGASSTNYGVENDSSSPTMTNVTASASGGTWNYGVYNNSSSPAMTNVTASAPGGASSTNYGVYNNSSSPAMVNVTASASGGGGNFGVFNVASSPTMTNVTAAASGGSNSYGVANLNSSLTIQSSVIAASGGTSRGISNTGSGSYTLKVNNSRITAGTNTIQNGSAFTTQVGASQLGGGGSAVGSGLTCVYSYNDSFLPLNSSCQP